jgi:hypothetical protein
MPIETRTPEDELRERHHQIMSRDPHMGMDDQELREREEAAQAYAGEDEKHFVAFAQDCIDTSMDATRDLRQMWDLCWRVYNEEEPASYAAKEAWQSKIIVPKPFMAIQYGAAAVKKAFSPDYLSIEDEANATAGDFWKTHMTAELGASRAKFVAAYIDALIMALAVGVSQELIPIYTPGAGLVFVLADPWKILRDPDAPPRAPQGGMYWIHQEWLDFYVLKEGEKKGRYQGVDRSICIQNESGLNDEFMSKEAIEARKKQIYKRSKFRKLVLTSEFWGTVLDSKGDLLLPSATYTVAGGRVIAKPKRSPYQRLRWPGINFSPLPNILSNGGRGLLQGVSRVWESMNNLMCLYEDALIWVVNPPKEINVDLLVDPDDVECWPGKEYPTKDSLHGNQAIRATQQRDPSSSAMAAGQYLDQMFQGGSAVNDTIQGLPGYRAEVTARERSQNLQQTMGIYALMGFNLEQGAIEVVEAARDVVESYAGWADLKRIHGEEKLLKWGIFFDGGNPRTSRTELPRLSGRFSISGIQALMKDAEVLDHIINTVIPLANTPRFAPYVRPRNVLKSFEKRSGLKDEELFVTDDDTGGAIETAEWGEYKQGKHVAQVNQQLALQEQMRRITEALPAPGTTVNQGEAA